MSRRRFLTARELADELRVPLAEVMDRVESGGLRIMVPPRHEIRHAIQERGGGLDLLGQYKPSGLVDWLRAYLTDATPVTDPVRARAAALPFTDGQRLYVTPRAVAERVRGKFHPAPTYGKVTDELRRHGAWFGKALGGDSGQHSGRLLWWCLPLSLQQEVMKS